MANLELYNKFRTVPAEAMKKITGGRFNGMTDINPMWRMKKLTEEFGPCGIGWKYEVTDMHLNDGANGEIAAFVTINLFYKVNNEWSEPIPGTGGSMFVASQKSGLYTSDECFKMALTDAISVAAKALGMGADVYFDRDKTKYTNSLPNAQNLDTTVQKAICPVCGKEQSPIKGKDGRVRDGAEVIQTLGGMCAACHKANNSK